MSKSTKGTLEHPGSQVKSKSGLNRSILDQGWSEFNRQLAYQLKWRGGELITVNPQYTSQKCAYCLCVLPVVTRRMLIVTQRRIF